MTKPLITSRTDWSENLLQEVYGHIEDIGLNDLKLDVYTNQIEVISAEQMIDAYSSNGLPVHYNHWSFGKSFMRDFQKYQKGQMGLAYEIVINSNPCISYLMEENNAITQALVIAHAAFGHNHVFKNNYLFKEWTEASSIVDYMVFAKDYIRKCEEKYGEDEVEMVLDAAHSVSAHGVDKRKRKHKKKMSEEAHAIEAMKLLDEEQKNLDIIIKKTTIKEEILERDEDLDLVGDEENLLYFIYKKAPNMEPWKRELLRIVYKIRQYFYPQGQTKTLNEGFATHTHYYIMNELEKRGIISPDAQIAWLHLHSNVIYQPMFDHKYYDGFNPYALGFSIFKEIRRVCENPTAEDREWFPEMVGKDWREMQKEAVADYRDESFIEQFMTPALIRELRLFSVRADGGTGVVDEISDEVGYRNIRRQLALQYNTVNYIPEISVKSARMRKDRTLTLSYTPYLGRDLHRKYRKEVLENIRYLWGYPVELHREGGEGEDSQVMDISR
jgi:stage V sporulation protein R